MKLKRIQKANWNEFNVIGWKLRIMYLLNGSIFTANMCIKESKQAHTNKLLTSLWREAKQATEDANIWTSADFGYDDKHTYIYYLFSWICGRTRNK